MVKSRGLLILLSLSDRDGVVEDLGGWRVGENHNDKRESCSHSSGIEGLSKSEDLLI